MRGRTVSRSGRPSFTRAGDVQKDAALDSENMKKRSGTNVTHRIAQIVVETLRDLEYKLLLGTRSQVWAVEPVRITYGEAER